MKTFLKANIASLSASFCDYLTTIFLIQFFLVEKLPAAVAGTIFGGIINFLIGRFWTFNANHTAFGLQSKKYMLVWIGNLLLNSLGFFILSNLFKIQYIIAKIATSLVVSFAYNYPLQKRYVFKISD